MPNRWPEPEAPEVDRAMDPDADGAVWVPYDGRCPLCRREMAMYARLRPCRPLRLVDLHTGPLPADAPAHERLMARLHARLPGGEWVHGAAAFVALWHCLPGWRWLARVARVPGVLRLLEGAYRGFLVVRQARRGSHEGHRGDGACGEACAPAADSPEDRARVR